MRVLRTLRDGTKYETRTLGEARGYIKCYHTLIRWGCVQGDALTELGSTLLAVAEDRRSRRMNGGV